MPSARRRSAPSARLPCGSDSRPDQRLLLGAALATSALLLLATLAGHPDLLPYAAPLFLVAIPLLAGRYVGEERLERMRSGLRRAPLRAPRAETPQAFRRPVAFLPRGGRLIAQSLAERPPPAHAPR